MTNNRNRSASVRRTAAVIATALALFLTACSPVKDRASDFDRALKDACATGKVVPARELISEPWDRMLIVEAYTPSKNVNQALGFAYYNDDEFTGTYGYTGLLVRKKEVVAEFNYDYGSERSPVQMPSTGIVFDAASLRVVPREETPSGLQAWLKQRQEQCVLLSSEDTQMLERKP